MSKENEISDWKFPDNFVRLRRGKYEMNKEHVLIWYSRTIFPKNYLRILNMEIDLHWATAVQQSQQYIVSGCKKQFSKLFYEH